MKKKAIYLMLAWIFIASAAAHAIPVSQATDAPMQPRALQQEQRANMVWQAFAGQSLRDTVAAWSTKAGYELVWDADFDFPVRAGVRLDGDFIQVVTNLFNAYAAADRPLSVDIFKEQKLVRVQARGE